MKLKNDPAGMVKIFDGTSDTPELIWDAEMRAELRTVLACELDKCALGSEERSASRTFCLAPESFVRYAKLKDELCVCGVYVSRFLKEPTFELRDPTRFLELLLLRWTKDIESQLTNHVGSPEQADCKTLTIAGQDTLLLLTNAIVFLCKIRDTLCDKLAGWGYMVRAVSFMEGLLEKRLTGNPLQLVLRLLHVAANRLVNVEALALTGESDGTIGIVYYTLEALGRDPLHRDTAFIAEFLKKMYKLALGDIRSSQKQHVANNATAWDVAHAPSPAPGEDPVRKKVSVGDDPLAMFQVETPFVPQSIARSSNALQSQQALPSHPNAQVNPLQSQSSISSIQGVGINYALGNSQTQQKKAVYPHGNQQSGHQNTLLQSQTISQHPNVANSQTLPANTYQQRSAIPATHVHVHDPTARMPHAPQVASQSLRGPPKANSNMVTQIYHGTQQSTQYQQHQYVNPQPQNLASPPQHQLHTQNHTQAPQQHQFQAQRSNPHVTKGQSDKTCVMTGIPTQSTTPVIFTGLAMGCSPLSHHDNISQVIQTWQTKGLGVMRATTILWHHHIYAATTYPNGFRIKAKWDNKRRETRLVQQQQGTSRWGVMLAAVCGLNLQMRKTTRGIWPKHMRTSTTSGNNNKSIMDTATPQGETIWSSRNSTPATSTTERRSNRQRHTSSGDVWWYSAIQTVADNGRGRDQCSELSPSRGYCEGKRNIHRRGTGCRPRTRGFDSASTRV